VTPLSTLAGVIEGIVSSTPAAFVTMLVRDLRNARDPIDRQRFSFTKIGSPVDAQLSALVEAWRDEPAVGASALAIAFEAALAARTMASSTVELVWTGPTTETASTLNTTAVLFSIVRRARKRLSLMSFSAFPIAGLLEELSAACDRGVEVRLILESVADSGGRLTIDAALPFERLRGRANFYAWPRDQRGPGAMMHAKVVVADGQLALVTSANLTERGVDSNFELGTYFEGNAIPNEIEQRLDDLVARGTLARRA